MDATAITAPFMWVSDTVKIDFSPPEIPLSPAFKISQWVIVISLPEKSIASFPVIDTFDSVNSPVQKSASNPSAKVFSILQFFTRNWDRMIFNPSSQWLFLNVLFENSTSWPLIVTAPVRIQLLDLMAFMWLKSTKSKVDLPSLANTLKPPEEWSEENTLIESDAEPKASTGI